MLLDSARRAYNEKNYSFARDRFREFLAKFGGHRDAAGARYGLALCLIEGPERDLPRAVEELNQLAGARALPEYPHVQYYSGFARRGLGVASLETARAKPAEANTHRDQARQRFDEAAKFFATAAGLFAERGKDAKADKGLPPDLEWAARARCDEAEMLLRLGKPKEARAALSLFTGDEAKKWRASRYADLGIYQAGLAHYLLGEKDAAGKLLSRTSVLDDEVFGTHARYLLARIHHENTKANEREEARTLYSSVLKSHEEGRKKAEARLRGPLDPDTKARLERLVRGPAPEHVARSNFYLGVLQYEDGRFGEALAHFQAFEKLGPDARLLPEARLRQGFCLIQTKDPKNIDDGVKLLQALADKEADVSDQALFWIARAQVLKVDPAKGGKFDAALDTFRRAAQKAQDRTSADPSARGRKAEILGEYARTLIAAGNPREAAKAFRQILDEKLAPERDDEVLLDLATAHQLGAEYDDSEKAAARFLEKHKDSPLLPALLFRQAENSTFLARLARKHPNAAERPGLIQRNLDQAIARYTALIAKYPESPHANYARQGLGAAQYEKGDLDAARKALESIPQAERAGELASVSYQLADILLRKIPAKVEDDAVAAGRASEALKAAADHLEAYLSAAAEAPAAPDALLRLGHIRQRQAALLADKAEKARALTDARGAYERLLAKHAKHEAAPQAVLERAKVILAQGDPNQASNELRRFQSDPLNKAPAAPMALLTLANLQRAQGKPADAAATLEQCRKAHEEALGKDPARAWQVGLVRYHHAAALREAGKLDEARALFDEVTRGSPDRPEGWDAALRSGEALRARGEARLAEAKKKLREASKPEQRAEAEKLLADGVKDLRAAVEYWTARENDLKSRKPASEDAQRQLAMTRARILHEAAWGWRGIAEQEVEAAREKIRQARLAQRREDLSKGLPPGSPPPQVAVPEVALKDVPAQPAEAQARAAYQALIKAFPSLEVSLDAYFELAELYAARGEHAEARKQLEAALAADREPSQELLDRIKLRLGSVLLDQGSRKIVEARRQLARGVKPEEKAALEKRQAEGRKDIEAALEQVQAVTANEKGKLHPQALYREAECLLQLGKADDAIKLLAKFRDDGRYQNLPGLSDRALLRLGAALGDKGQWDASRQAYQAVLDRTGGASPWAHDARYGIGWAYQSQGQHDQAVNTYSQVTAAVATELAAKAQLNIGLCRLAQKRHAEAATALLVVPFTYDYPELSALALLEAARALHEDKKTAQAVTLLKRILRDHAGSPQADAARKRLTDLGES
jgi:TolA-binding protein